jgi:hypothetical protein
MAARPLVVEVEEEEGEVEELEVAVVEGSTIGVIVQRMEVQRMEGMGGGNTVDQEGGVVAAGYAVVSHKVAEVQVKGRKQQVGP